MGILVMSMQIMAQSTVLKGTFYKMLTQIQMANNVFLYKQEKGGLTTIDALDVTKADQSFEFDVKKEDIGVIRYVGFSDEFYPVFLREGEDLRVDVKDGNIVYSGNISAENKVFSDWYKLIEPMRKLGYSEEGRRLTPEDYTKTLESLITPVNNFIKKINTGNKKFDSYVKYMLNYSFKCDVLRPFMLGFGFVNKTDYPEYIAKMITSEKFSDKNIWSSPFGNSYITTLGFLRHIVYNGEQGYVSDLVIPEISSPELKAEFILDQVENGYAQNPGEFIAKNSKYMLTRSQKNKMKTFEKRFNMKQPGGEWMDFAYPDLEGKIHHLSDYLGKVVVIDVWATWCVPCVKEQPFLEELEKSFENENVVFISISMDKDKKKWAEMVQRKKLSGIHLRSNQEGPIIEDYGVETIPRFIVFDQDGKTVSFDAPRPSDPKLKALIQSKL